MVFLKSTKQHAYVPPIVSACGTATYYTAKFITKILQNYCGKTSSFVKDSTDFIKKMKHLSINPEEETLVSFDVNALFTNIPVPVALQVVNFKISTCTNFTNVCKIPTEYVYLCYLMSHCCMLVPIFQFGPLHLMSVIVLTMISLELSVMCHIVKPLLVIPVKSNPVSVNYLYGNCFDFCLYKLSMETFLALICSHLPKPDPSENVTN